MNKTKIEWTEYSWNPVTGCTPISEGCQNCYAKRMSKRLAGRCGYSADDPFKVTLHPERLEEPLKWKKPRRVFVCSMSDLFHPDVPDEFIEKVWEVMKTAKQHTFLILTKRAARMSVFLAGLGVLPNVWLGVTAENQQRADERVPILLRTPAVVRFVSIEPMLGPVDLPEYLPPVTTKDFYVKMLPDGRIDSGYRKKLDWVICGGETGPDARLVHPDWVRNLRDQCKAAGVPFFFKGWGEWVEVTEGGVHPGDICMSEDGFIDMAGKDYVCFANESDGTLMRRVGKKKAGRLLDGRTWDEMPCIK